MRKIIIGIILVFCVLPLPAQISDSVWQALREREVLISKLDGSQVQGILIGVEEMEVTVMRSDGRVVTVMKFDAEDVIGITAPSQPRTPETQAAEDFPLGERYFLFNPLGFLQIGPVLEYGFLVAPELYIAPTLRIFGMGLLAHILIEGSLGIHSSFFGVSATRSMPAAGANRLYLGTNLELGFVFDYGEDSIGKWKGNTGVLIWGSRFGYTWRNPSRFFTNLGVFAGLGFPLWNNWYYVDDPGDVRSSDLDVYIVGGLEVSIGWEIDRD